MLINNLNSVQVINKPCVCSSTMRLSSLCGLHGDDAKQLCAMGHFDGFGTRYGPLHRMSCTVKICDNFCVVGHRYGPKDRIWLCAMGPSTGFCLAVQAIAQDFVMHHGSQCQTNTIAQNYTICFFKTTFVLQL